MCIYEDDCLKGRWQKNLNSLIYSNKEQFPTRISNIMLIVTLKKKKNLVSLYFSFSNGSFSNLSHVNWISCCPAGIYATFLQLQHETLPFILLGFISLIWTFCCLKNTYLSTSLIFLSREEQRKEESFSFKE